MNSSRTQDPTARQVKKIRAKVRIIRDSMRISIVLLLVRCDLRGKREIKSRIHKGLRSFMKMMDLTTGNMVLTKPTTYT